jgi:hypothetical protein
METPATSHSVDTEMVLRSGLTKAPVQKEPVPETQFRRRIFCYQSIGFIAIIAVCMLDELIGLSTLVLGDQNYIIDFRESITKALIIFVVWFLVVGSTGRLLAQMRYLEKFTRVCSWCRRVEHKGNWMAFEQFLKLRLDTSTSHGICQECLKRARKAWNLENNTDAKS